MLHKVVENKHEEQTGNMAIGIIFVLTVHQVPLRYTIF